MNSKTVLFRVSILMNIILVIMLGVVMVKTGGASYFVTKASAILGLSEKNDETEIPEYLKRQSLFELLPIEENSTVFLGDSLIGGVDWSELLQSREFVGRGISGDDSRGVLKRLESVVSSKPKKIFIMIGVNDLYAKGEPLDLIKNYSQIIDSIHEASPNTKIYIQSILPINTDKYALKSKTKMTNEIIRKANVDLKDLSSEKNVTFIDLYSLVSINNDELNPDYTFDGLHLSGEAYMVWKDAIKEHLN